MAVTWKARQMVPGRDTIKIMALHYSLKPSTVRDVIKQASVEVIREDGFRGTVTLVEPFPWVNQSRKRKVLGWSDGEVGVDMATTKLTKAAIMAVARWKFSQDSENDSDN